METIKEVWYGVVGMDGKIISVFGSRDEADHFNQNHPHSYTVERVQITITRIQTK